MQVQGTSRRNNPLLVDLDSWERRNLRSSSDDDVLSLDLSLTTVGQLDVELCWRGERSLSLDVVDAVLLEQERLDTAGERLDRVVLGGQHGGEVELDALDVDTSALEVMRRLVIDMRVVQPG